MVKGNPANEIEVHLFQKSSASLDHSVMSGAHTLAFCIQIRRERAEETAHGQRFQ
jgi:hypothetical protein